MRENTVTSGRAAELLGLSAREFDRLCRRGDLPQPPLLSGRRRWRPHDIDRARKALIRRMVPCAGCASPTIDARGLCATCQGGAA